jgi:RNA polymerase sigma-70 factor (ECF subfamily)
MKDFLSQHVSDNELAKAGSFDDLVHRYTGPVYNFVFRLTGNRQVAEDLTQETFIKVWKNLAKYDTSHNFRAWLFTIARNTCTDYLRKKKSIPFSTLSPDADLPFEETLADSEPLPEKTLEKIEDSELLEQFLAELPPDYRIVLVLHYQEEMTFDEIGNVLGKPLNTVKSHHRRALEMLRKLAES